MNNLPFEKQVAVISALTERCSIRAIERLTGIHRDTIMRLAVASRLLVLASTIALFIAFVSTVSS